MFNNKNDQQGYDDFNQRVQEVLKKEKSRTKNKKRHLIVGVILFLIIIIGLVVAGYFYLSKISEKNNYQTVQESKDQVEKDYYDLLEEKCAGQSCCLSSLKLMKENSYKECINGKCQLDFKCNGMGCESSLSWCEPKKEQKKKSEINTSDWKTYRNEKLGIEFNYPQNWTLKKSINEIAVCNPEYLGKNSAEGEFCGITLTKDNKYFSLDELENYLSKAENNNPGCVKRGDRKKIIFKKASSESIEYSICGVLSPTTIAWIIDDYYYSFDFRTDEDIAREIIKTINFIKEDKWAVYEDKELGVKFSYEKKCEIKKENNKVIVCGDQSVEILNKDKNKTLKESIEEDFLKDYSSEKCFFEKINRPNNSLEYGIISFPIVVDSDLPWWNNNKNCPKQYSETNGIRYFMANSTYSDRYVFFDIGQYAIMGSEDKTWQETLKFIDQNETAGWKTYRNEEVGVSIKYPNDGTYKIEEREKNFAISQDHPGERFNIFKGDSCDKLLPQNIYKGDVKINDLEFKKYNLTGMLEPSVYLHKNDLGCYMFEAVKGPENRLFEEMMKTVLFINQDKTDN